MYPKLPLSIRRKVTLTVAILLLAVLFAVVIRGRGVGCFSIWSYCVDETVIMAAALILLGIILFACRRQRSEYPRP